MSKPTKSNTLADLATRVQNNAVLFERSWHGEEFAKQLKIRRDQLNGFIERVEKLAQQRNTIVAFDSKLRVPKRRLSPAIKKIEKLESSVQIDISKIVEADALDTSTLVEAFSEVEQAMLDAWQKFAKPPKDITGADALANVPELEETVRKLRVTREQLEIQGKQLPTNTKDVTTVRTLQQQLRTLTDQLQTHGYDEEVLAFLTQTRIAHRGVPLTDTLNKPKIRKWLESGKNASSFIILHKSVLNANSPLPTQTQS